MRAVIALASLSAAASAASVAPTQKVIQLLQDMSAKGKARMQAEQVAFAKFSTFCENEQGSLANEIKDGKASMENLQANILKYSTDADTLGDEIAGLNKDINGYQADKKAQEDERAATHEEFQATQKDLSESVDALGRALVILQRQNYDRKQAASFLQTSVSIPPRAKALIADFLALREDGDDDADFLGRSGPEANAYENQSGGIIGMLKKLEKKFKTELNDAEMGETNSRHAFEMAVQDLVASIAASNEAVGKKTVSRNKALNAAAKSQKELETTTATFNENTKTLADLKVECEQKTLSFEEKQKLSADELEALAEATKILSGDSVSGAADEHLTASSRLSFVQIASRTKSKETSDVLAFLASQGKKIHSDKLSLLAQKIANDPFLKVKKMIKAMVNKLMNEQNEEAETKGFCDKELRTNKLTRDRLNGEMDKLSAQFDQSTAEAKQLGESVAKLAAEVSALDNAVKEASAIRADEKAKNTDAIADAKAAQQAVAQATSVLKEFYAKAGGATAFIQVPKMGSDEWNALANPNFPTGGAGYGQGSEDKVDKGHKAGMQTFGDSYSGQQDSANGVLAMLEVILSDFANLETETATTEAESAKSHDRFLVDSKRDKKVKERQIEMNSADKEAAEHDAKEAKRDLSTTDDQLRAADRYYESLKPKCVDEGVSFEERNAKRQEEIDSLKEALQMLQPQE